MQSNGLLSRNEGQSMVGLDGNSQPLVVTTSKKSKTHSNQFAFGVSIESSVFIWILSTLAVISFLNLASALWVIKVLQLNSAGLGKGSFNFLPNGINIRSDVNVLGQLVSKSIWSKDKEKAFKITSGLASSTSNLKDSQLLLNAWDDANFLSLDSNKLEVQSEHFVLRDSNVASGWMSGTHEVTASGSGDPVNGGEGQSRMDKHNNNQEHSHLHPQAHPDDEKVLMEVTSDRLTLSSVEQVVSPAGGINLHSTLQSNSIHGSTHHDMHLQSRRKSVYIDSPEQVNIESRAGPSTLSAYGSICINSHKLLNLHSKSILFSGLKVANPRSTSPSKASLQVCACESGLVYTVSGDGVCSNSHLCDQSPLE